MFSLIIQRGVGIKKKKGKNNSIELNGLVDIDVVLI
jgi:hypothetical protein